MTQEEAEDLVQADYEAVLGKVFGVVFMVGYVGDDQQDLYFSPPLKVRIGETPAADLFRWDREHLDPIWIVEPVATRSAMSDLNLNGLCWIFGHSYNVKTGETERTELHPCESGPTYAQTVVAVSVAAVVLLTILAMLIY